MKKIPLVIALGAASLCSFAQAQSSVQVYGRLYPYLNSESSSNPTATGTPVATLAATPAGLRGVTSIKGMAAGNSNIGFKGTEGLGGGLKAVFQLEGSINVDDGGSGFSFNRNTFVGLEGGFGEIKLGLMDTVFKEYGDTLGILGVSSGTPMSSSNMLRKVGFGTSSASRFHERRANSIRYDSPNYGGVEFAAQVATQENPTATIGAAKTYSLGVKYDKGPIYVALAHEIHDNFFGGSANSPSAMRNNGAGTTVTSKDTATQLTVEWRINKQHKVEFDVIRKNYDESATVTGRFKSYNNIAYLVGMDSRWSPQWRTAVQFVKSQAGSCSRVAAVCSTDGLEGSKFIVGGSYYLARRTYLFAAYNQVTNGKSARFSVSDFGTANPGEDTKQLIAGISHGF